MRHEEALNLFLLLGFSITVAIGYPRVTPPPPDPTSYYGYGIAEVQLLGPPVYNGDYTVEFTRSLAGQNVDQLAVDASSVAGISISTAQQGQVGDWTVDLAKGVQPGQSRTEQGLIPGTTYQIRWEAVGYAPEDVTPSDPTTITMPEEVDALIRNPNDVMITGGDIVDAGWVGLNIHNLDGTGQTESRKMPFPRSMWLCCMNRSDCLLVRRMLKRPRYES